MKIFFNHHISCISDIIEMIRASHPDVGLAASHERSDSPLHDVLEGVIQELPCHPDGGMPDVYPDWLIETARGQGADTVIPYRHRRALAAHAPSFEAAGLRLLTAGDTATLDLIESKVDLLTRAAGLGLPITPFEAWQDSPGFDRSIEALRAEHGPHVGLCIKPSTGIYGAGFRVLVDDTRPGALKKLLDGFGGTIGMSAFRELLSGEGVGGEMMTMPFLGGVERSVDFACLDGHLLGAVSREKRRGLQIIGHDAPSIEMARVLCEELKLSGLVNLQTLEDDVGQQRLLEVNSRAAGGIGMTRVSGVNLAGLLVAALRGVLPPPPIIPEKMVQVARRESYEVIA